MWRRVLPLHYVQCHKTRICACIILPVRFSPLNFAALLLLSSTFLSSVFFIFQIVFIFFLETLPYRFITFFIQPFFHLVVSNYRVHFCLFSSILFFLTPSLLLHISIIFAINSGVARLITPEGWRCQCSPLSVILSFENRNCVCFLFGLTT